MPRLADTNILLRFVDTTDADHKLVRGAITSLMVRGERLCYTQQNRREFWNVCTRPRTSNGLGLTVAQTAQNLQDLDTIFDRLYDRPETGPEWDRLVTQYQVIGRAVHDAQLVAAMIVHGITHILTLNVTDFARYTEVTAVHPQDVPAASTAEPRGDDES